MNYGNKSLHPDVLEFYYPSKTKVNKCHPHQHVHPQHAQRMQITHIAPQQTLVQKHPSYPGSHEHQTALPPVGRIAHHGLVVQQHPSDSDNFHHGQRHRLSASPVQTLSSACGSSSTTLTSSSGYFTTGTSNAAGGSGIHVHKHTASLRASDLSKLLREKLAMLPGGRSKRGGPILCFPANSHADDVPFEDLCLLVWYLTYLPEDRVKKLGFTVIVDMRNGTTWHSVKPILKAVETCVGQNVTITFIIKPDKLIEKHKANMSIGKFSFEIQLVSIDSLFREVDPSQLTSELEGSLPYHHEEWIKIRCCLEEFFFSAHDMSNKFSQLFYILERKLELDNVDAAKRALEEHRSLRLKIFQAPVSALEAEADRLTAWLRYGLSAANSVAGSCASSQAYTPYTSSGNCVPFHVPTTSGSAGGASFLATSWVSMNPDFQQLLPQVRQTVTKLYEFRTHLQQKWESGRSRLEQIHQLRIFEEDANRMSVWLGQQRHLFLTEYLDIGQTASHAADLVAEHRQFVDGCSAAFEQIARLNGVAGMLADVGHFATQQILKQASQLEHEWKSFVAALEDRSRVLCLSANFHSRAQAFLANCPHRDAAMRQVNGTTVNELHEALLTLQNYWQEAQSAREEVCEDARALTNLLSAPVPTGSHTSLTAAVDYSQGRKHCTDLVHEIWAWFKQLERIYSERKSRLTSRLSLLMFKEDVGQVLSWLTDHGEPFLQRQTSVGKSITRAEQLYNTHMQFEQVAAKTLMNAEKLISVADELAALADDAEEILQRASELQRRISAFTRAVEARRETVDLGCGFYGHTKEVLAWLHNIKEAHNTGEHLPATIEGMEDELTNFHRDRTSIEDGADRVASEGEALIAHLKDPEEIAHIRSVLAQVAAERTTVSSLLIERQLRLDLCLQLRLFEADVNSALDCLRHNVPPYTNSQRSETSSVGTVTQSPGGSNHCPWLSDPRQAPDISSLEEVSNACLSVLPTAEEVLHKGAELARAFESVGVNFPAGGPGSSDSGVGDSVESAVERVHRLSNELAEAVASVDELNERLTSELDWRRLQTQSKQVLHWISQCEDILRETSVIPANLAEAQALQAEHEKLQPVLNDAHPQAVQCTARASMLLLQAANSNSTSGSGTQAPSGGEHPRKKDYRAIAEAVADHWQKLVYAAEDRHKLLITAVNWYKTSDQVTSVLWSLEKEYHREEDWCQNEKAGDDVAAYLHQLSVKHAEQKEAFLKACMLARRTSDVFSRYLHRQPTSATGRAEVEEKIRTAMNELMAKEQAVLEAWAVRRRRLDDCIYFINIKTQVEELLVRVQNQSRAMLNSPTKFPSVLAVSTQLGSSLIQEVHRACESLDSMINAPMPLSSGHTTQLRGLLRRLHSTLPPSALADFSVAPAPGKFSADPLDAPHKPPAELRKPGVTLGVRWDSRVKQSDADTDRTSISSASSSGTGSTGGVNADVPLSPSTAASTTPGPTPEQRRMIRRRENLLRELIQTERSYIRALGQCLETYRQNLASPHAASELKIPAGLLGKVDVVFGNMPAIYAFHRTTFEPELGKYTESGDFLPEDVGHCFVVHSDRLAELYVDYCVNHTEATRLLIDHDHGFFQSVQHHHKLVEPLQSYLIKPVQRVTKYQLLLRELRDCCDPASVAELNEGLEAMLDVPKRANDALHLSMLHGLPDDLPISSLGDVILQDQFTVWEPKQLIKKSRERRVFLFDNCLILAKEAPTQPGEHKAKYHYKSRLVLAECNITEHIEGDQCKFALWTGRVPPISEYRMVLKANGLELKQTWVRALREVMRERMFSVQRLYQHQQSITTGKLDVLSDEAELLDTYYILENFQATQPNEVSVTAHQIVQVLHRCDTPHLPDMNGFDSTNYNPNGPGDWVFVRMLVQGSNSDGLQSSIREGFIPARLLGAPSGRRRTSTTSNRRSSTTTSARKWLLTVNDSKQATSVSSASVKRSSKTDMNHTQLLSTPYPTASSRRGPSDYQPPRLSTKPAAPDVTILDNVSEESIDVELPPPMNELQVLPTSSPTVDTDQTVDDPLETLVDSGNMRNCTSETVQHDLPNRDEFTDRTTTMVPRVVPVAEVSAVDGPKLIGLPSGASLVGLGQLRLHGGLSVAAKLVSRQSFTTSSTAPDEELLRGMLDEAAELRFVNRHLLLYDRALVIADAAFELVPLGDTQQSTSTQVQLQCHFRHAMHISQISLLEDISAPGSKPIGDQLLWFCLSERTRHPLIPFSNTAVSSESVATTSPQSYLCYVVAPQSPDTRIRWLTELGSLLLEARRLSQAFSSMSTPLEGISSSGDPGSSVHTKLSSAVATLYPSGLFFEPNFLDLPRLGRLSSGTFSSPSRCKASLTADKANGSTVSALLETVSLNNPSTSLI